MKLRRFVLGMCTALGLCAAQAGAVQREFVSFAAVNSDGNTHTLTVNFTGGFEVKQIVYSATLLPVASNTRGHESLVQVRPPNGAAPFVLQPITQDIITGGASVSRVTFTLPQAIPAGQSGGTWSFDFFESFDDAGVDAEWDSLIIRLDDGVAPPSVNLGALNQFPVHLSRSIAAGQVQFYRISLTEDVTPSSHFLDIDTEGSSVLAANGVNDTEIALYDSRGVRIADDDDNGSNNLSQLTFGAGSRAPVGNGQPYNGRDGVLPAGVYYVAVAVFNTTFGNGGWGVFPPATGAGTITLNIRTDTGRIDCQADYNHSGEVNSQDFFDFLNDFFLGCD